MNFANKIRQKNWKNLLTNLDSEKWKTFFNKMMSYNITIVQCMDFNTTYYDFRSSLDNTCFFSSKYMLLIGFRRRLTFSQVPTTSKSLYFPRCMQKKKQKTKKSQDVYFS